MKDEPALERAVARTLLHEVGHLRGEDDGSLRDRGLEWIYRLGREPGRLILRYLRTNPVFFERVLRELWTR